MSHQKFFGAYLHALTIHAPLQYEIICLRSVNTENQERLFQQAKKIAISTTNRKPENVIPSIMLRPQAKQLSGKVSAMYQASETEVVKVAAKVPPFNGTSVTSEFITSRLRSWQGHLERISSYLVVGEGIWWSKKVDDLFVFNDGDTDIDYRSEGPDLKHFRSMMLQDIPSRSQKNWKKIIKENISLPTTCVRLFDEYGVDELSTPTVSFDPTLTPPISNNPLLL